MYSAKFWRRNILADLPAIAKIYPPNFPPNANYGTA